MMIIMSRMATEKMILSVIERLKSRGREVQRHDTQNRTCLEVTPRGGDLNEKEFLLMDGVADVMKLSSPLKLAGREYQNEKSVVDVDGVKIGGDEIVIMAGPCSVENEGQIEVLARVVAKAGAKLLRGGAFKPRTSPYSFQGLGEEGLVILRKAADASGLKVVSEVMSIGQIELLQKYAHVIQVGTRNMANYDLLKSLGKIGTPILLKRGMGATIEEWLMAAEYILAGGNPNVILCERGIRTFDSAKDMMLDLSAIPIVNKLSHLPVVADPSHGTGFRDYVSPMARAAVAAGADGLLVEVHHEPESAMSDGPQALIPEQFEKLMDECRKIAEAIGRKIA